ASTPCVVRSFASSSFLLFMIRPPTHTTLFPYTTLFRSGAKRIIRLDFRSEDGGAAGRQRQRCNLPKNQRRIQGVRRADACHVVGWRGLNRGNCESRCTSG